MREFIFGNEAQFKNFKEVLDDHMCHVYDCTMPPGCSPETSRIGFEYVDGEYRILVDYGITCDSQSNDTNLLRFKQLLEAGKIAFTDYDDMRDFLTNLQFLYD